MKRIYIRESLVEEAVATKKAKFTSDMCLNLINGVSYQLIIAIKFLNEVANNESDEKSIDLSGLIISKDELIARNYDLFDDEIVADDKLYKVEIGYIGELLSDNKSKVGEEVDIIKTLKTEHCKILEVATEISDLFSEDTCNCEKINRTLENLFDILLKHLKKEDLYLYPKGFKSPEKKVVSNTYSVAMKEISSVAMKYYNHWSGKINDWNLGEFKDDTKSIFDVLNSRIENEESNLYPLF